MINYQNSSKKQLLYIEDRPMILTDRILKCKEVLPVILRFKHLKDNFSQQYLRETEQKYPVFWVDIMIPIEQEAERFLYWQSKKGLKVEFFLNPSEVAQYYAQTFARYLGLPSLTEEQTICCKNKVYMKDKLNEIGLNTAKYRVVVTTEELIEAGTVLGWPIVLKPANESSCRETYLIKNTKEAIEINLHSQHQWLAEEYIDLDEYAIDALVFNGKIIDYYLTKYPAPLLQTFKGAINANITLRHISPEMKNAVEDILNKYVNGMGFRYGYIHMEYFADEEHSRVIVGEVGLRIAGSDILSNHELSFGFDIYDAVIKIHTGEYPELVYTEDRFVGNLLLPIKQGIIKHISTLDELLKFDGVIDGQLKVKEGQKVKLEGAAHECSGILLVEGQCATEVQERMLEVLNHFKLVVE
ncbi:ATP-grasp domain-containing protein [Anoxybacillus sp. J5B_2022]|uniref:ATP-grasp domain-containing protein n=1 Tax=Anoxybacillus sp. J5B_2022 TaxID=3003246 RepID=UPI002285761F|nr:ATP-grasp domain-containing protein [Anoxybacillus sp. J5B_2022]MCZ0756142.1 ATP-grasp domain-containing protein [Anoxybacillus sp. J5B_2022]